MYISKDGGSIWLSQWCSFLKTLLSSITTLIELQCYCISFKKGENEKPK
uniref:Uncharacterized protein n=1 Tax=Arundo donax TaxID=35708 RepID=A0A0A8ZDV1_ARUDO